MCDIKVQEINEEETLTSLKEVDRRLSKVSENIRAGYELAVDIFYRLVGLLIVLIVYKWVLFILIV